MEPGSRRVLDMLSKVSIFSACDRLHLEQIAGVATVRKVAAGEDVIRETEPGNEMYLVLSGTATCVSSGHQLADFGPSSWFGELALLQGGFRTATVTATSDMELLEIGAREFHELLHQNPDIAIKLLNVLAGRLRHLNDELALVD